MTATRNVRARLRRYPALGFLAVAALLASLLPSALRVPLSGPSASAELAPVPGKSDSAQGDLSALGQTSSGGLGAGAGIGGLGALGPGGSSGGDDRTPPHESSPPPGSGRNPAQKRCVGKPARQTEDPLSPACVAYFKGDNFGATSKGVTRDEIRVVLFGGCSTDGRYEVHDLDHDRSNTSLRQTAGYARYFNERFQTYDRRVHVYSVTSDRGGTGQCQSNSVAGLKSVVQSIDAELDPFYLISPTRQHPALSEEAARLGIVSSTLLPRRPFARANAPYVVSYRPDLEHMAASVAESVCARLAGRPARFHGDPTQRGTTRKFGLFYDHTSDPDGVGADLVLAGLRNRCPAEAGEVVIGYVRGRGQSREDVFARFRLAGVTTVLLRDVRNTEVFATADASGWQGEWFNFNETLEGQAAGLSGGQTTRLFGLIGERRLGQPAEQHHRQVVAAECSDCTVALIDAYNEFMLLFTGIQAAGPRLTPANMDKGLRALPARQSRDPFAPSAYFGPTDHFLVKDYMLGWWDPAGRTPGSNVQGCWRLVEDGLRYRPEDWAARPGDDGIQQRTPEQPCQGTRDAL